MISFRLYTFISFFFLFAQPFKKHLKDFIQEVKLLSKDNSDTKALPSTSSGTYTKPSSHSRRSLKNKKLSLNENNENSIDADDSLDLELALNFPKDMEKYTDDIWRKTLSDCDPSIHTPWEKQPEVNKTPSIVWPSTSSDEMYSPMRSQFFPDFWSGGNIFFPTSTAPSTSSSTAAATARNSSVSDLKHQRKVPIGKSSTATTTGTVDDDDFNSIKKRLSLSSLRSSLCRQKGNESMNIARTSASDDDDDDVDFLQVLISFSLIFCFAC